MWMLWPRADEKKSQTVKQVGWDKTDDNTRNNSRVRKHSEREMHKTFEDGDEVESQSKGPFPQACCWHTLPSQNTCCLRRCNAGFSRVLSCRHLMSAEFSTGLLLISLDITSLKLFICHKSSEVSSEASWSSVPSFLAGWRLASLGGLHSKWIAGLLITDSKKTLWLVLC